jgi:DNA gyrase inhibitor GyrI
MFIFLFVLGSVLSGFVAAQEKNESGSAAGAKTAQAAAADSIRLIPVDPYFYCVLEMKGSFDQHGSAFQNLYQQAGMQGLPMSAVPFGLYWNSPTDTPVDSLKWELGFALQEAKTLTAPLVLKKWEYPLVASIAFDGVYGSESQNATTGRLFGWIQQNGYKPAGPLMEKFLTMPTPTADGAWSGKVEIVVPVAEAK